jgi:hypothetical protein
LTEDYNRWYGAAPAQTQARWKKNLDPLFIKADRLIDAAEIVADTGGDTTDQVEQLIQIKSEILKLLAKEGFNGSSGNYYDWRYAFQLAHSDYGGPSQGGWRSEPGGVRQGHGRSPGSPEKRHGAYL